MRFRRRRYGVILNLAPTIIAVAAVVCFIIALHRPSLEIRNSYSGKVYDRRSLETGGEFAIEFIHSVNQSPVRETFRIEKGQIRPVAVRFYSFGAGMLSDLEEGRHMDRDGDAMVITGFSQSFRELNYIVGTVSDHLLLINGETVSLRALCGQNAHITLRAR